jgi:hypothetical protein
MYRTRRSNSTVIRTDWPCALIDRIGNHRPSALVVGRFKLVDANMRADQRSVAGRPQPETVTAERLSP